MHPLTLLFLGALSIGTLLRLWLSIRRERHVMAHRENVPPAFAHAVSLESHHKAADYTAAKSQFYRKQLLVGVVLLLFWSLGGGLNGLDQLWRGLELGELATGVGFLMSFLLLSELIDLPMSAAFAFGIETRFGFNRQTPALFVSDTIKGLLLTMLIGAPLAAIVLWLMQSMGSLWWVYVWIFWTGFGLLANWAYPVLIAPLFNRFDPLDKGPLRDRIEGLLERCGFESQGISVMDGSRRSAHGNAYFAGFGRQKRIVFFDTLLKSLSDEEVEAVLAHELGHFKRRHVTRMMVTSTVVSGLGLMLLGWLVQKEWFFKALGMQQPSMYAALALFVLVMPTFTFFLSPIGAYFSRRQEFEADDFAAQQTSARHLVTALVKMYEENAASLTPEPLHSAFYDSHPPAPVRIANLERKL